MKTSREAGLLPFFIRHEGFPSLSNRSQCGQAHARWGPTIGVLSRQQGYTQRQREKPFTASTWPDLTHTASSLKCLAICQDALLRMSSLTTCASRAHYTWSFPNFEAIPPLFTLLSGSQLLSALRRCHLQRHSSSLCFARFPFSANFIAPKVPASLHSHRPCSTRDSRCPDPDFGLVPITFEVSIMDWYAALHQTHQPVLACTN